MMRNELHRIFLVQDRHALDTYLEIEDTVDIMQDLRALVASESVKHDDVQIIEKKLGGGWLKALANKLREAGE